VISSLIPSCPEKENGLNQLMTDLKSRNHQGHHSTGRTGSVQTAVVSDHHSVRHEYKAKNVSESHA
jgi:hypothetical protein